MCTICSDCSVSIQKTGKVHSTVTRVQIIDIVNAMNLLKVRLEKPALYFHVHISISTFTVLFTTRLYPVQFHLTINAQALVRNTILY